jgi:hypothetical protein
MNVQELPPGVARLLWDVEVSQLDLLAHADYILERIMARGDWEAMKWLRAVYSDQVRASFLMRRGRRLSPRDRAYWELVSGVSGAQDRGGGRPPWAG